MNNVPIGRYITQLHKRGRSFIVNEISQYGIGVGQIMFLFQLYQEDGLSQEELCEILDTDKGNAARAIKKLEEDNFVVRVKNEQDKRAYKIYLTEKGKSFKSGVIKAVEEWNNIIESTITEEESECLKNILAKICSSDEINRK